MNQLSKCMLLAAGFILAGTLANAQAEREQQNDVNNDTGYTEDPAYTGDESSGVASYNIDGNENQDGNDGAWRNEGSSGYGQETELIHVYSGKHDGDNIVRTIEVPLPVEGGGSFSYREYQAH